MSEDCKVLGYRESRVVCGLAGRDAGCFRGGPQTGVLCPKFSWSYSLSQISYKRVAYIYQFSQPNPELVSKGPFWSWRRACTKPVHITYSRPPIKWLQRCPSRYAVLIHQYAPPLDSWVSCAHSNRTSYSGTQGVNTYLIVPGRKVLT